MKWTNKYVLIALLSLLPMVGCDMQDMYRQPKLDTYEKSDFFQDGRGGRMPVEGTVARGHLREDAHLYDGLANGKQVNSLPFAMAKKDYERGMDRYNVFCAPCHAASGNGDGMVVRRGFPKPPSFHSADLRTRTLGHFFSVMTNGYGVMYSYASRIPVEDRWRIAAYLRAMQLSSQVPINDIPADEQRRLRESGK